MRILYHHRTRAADGGRVHIEELIASLRQLEHEVIVVAPVTIEAGGRAGDGAALVPRLRSHLPKALAELLEFGYAGYALLRLLAAYVRHRPDLLYERYNLFMPTGAWLKAITGIKVLLEVNGPLLAERQATGGIALERLARWSERTSWNSADTVLPVTAVLAGIIGEAGVPTDRIAVIPNGINPQSFPAASDTAFGSPDARPSGRLILGFTGYVRAWHGLDRVVRLLSRPELPIGVQLLLVGDGPARAEIEALATALGVADRVTITGIMPHEKVADHVATFDIALQPAVTEYASPLKLFEYMQLGRAIVAPDQPNIREVLTTGKDALLFDPGDAESLGDAILRLCGDPSLRRRLGTAARETIARNGYTWHDNAVRVARLAEQVTTRDPASPETARTPDPIES